MYEITMTYEYLLKYFKLYIKYDVLMDENYHELILINDEIYPYINYVTGFCEITYETCYYKICRIKKENERTMDLYSTFFNETDAIIFEFPDEETAFYFKLKFC